MAKGISLVRLEADTGSYERNIRQAQKTFDDFLKGIGVSVPKLGALTAAIGATTAALKVAKDAFMQSESNIDEWGRVTKSAQSAYSMFLDTLNGGNWSNFFENLKLAIQGGRDLYDALDRLSSVKANNQLAITITQAQIQQLRVLKQQGKDVDDQIKAASARLKALQMEGVSAGKQAGAQQIVNTLTRRIRGISGGEGISESDIAAAAKAYVKANIKNGQSYMESQAELLSSLQKKATYTYTQSLTLPGATSASEARKYKGLDLTRLTDEERKQYIIAKAITEGETELQQGMSTLSAAFQEQSAMWSQQFRNNRYELSGNGGSKGGSKASKGFSSLSLGYGITGTTESMRDLLAQKSYFQKQMSTATDFFSAADAQAGLEKVQKLIDAQPLALRLGISAEEMAKIQEKMGELGKNIKPLDFGKTDGVKTAKETASAWSSAAQAVSNVGSALQSLDDPSAKIAGIVGQAVANIALGFAQASASPATGAAGVFGWIAAATAGLATMVSTIASIKSATAGSYAEGGIVPGHSYSGDNMYGRLNAGELILSRSQQSSIANQLSDQRGRAVQSRPYVEGEKIYLGLTNYLRGSNRGELVTTR